jgi:uncharacterized membrane protein/YHS domain-containing protein
MRLILALIVLALAADPGSVAAEGSTPSAMCIVMPDREVDPDHHVEHEGTTYYFCCGKCVRKFKADPKKYLASAPAPTAKPLPPMLGRAHPAIVHFPIVCLLLAAAAEFWAIMRGMPFWHERGRFLAALAAVSAVTAVVSGWTLASDQPAELLERHRWYGVATAACAVVAALAGLFSRSGGWRPLWLYRLMLSAAAVLVVLTANLGGDMVYGRGWLW